jgi:hypothetical protein
MPKLLKGSCRCDAVQFSVESHTPHPYQLCYCSICRKTAGGGGYAINIMGDFGTLHATGNAVIRVYRAKIRHDNGRCKISKGERNFCSRCATALWMWDAQWPELVHPFASAIDTKLPVPPSRVHLMLKYKASWVEPEFGRGDQKFQEYPKQSIEEWHKKRGLWVD